MSEEKNKTDLSLPRVFKTYRWWTNEHKWGWIIDEITKDSIFFHPSCLRVELTEPYRIEVGKFKIVEFRQEYVYKLGVSPINGKTCCSIITKLDNVLVEEFIDNYDKYSDNYKKFIDSTIRPFHNYILSHPIGGINKKVQEMADILVKHLKIISKGMLFSCFEVSFSRYYHWDRDPDYNHWCNSIDAFPDDYVFLIEGMDKHIMDDYLYKLVSKKQKLGGLLPSNDIVLAALKDYYERWKKEIIENYDISQHIDSLIETIIRAEKNKQHPIQGICSETSESYYGKYLELYREELLKLKEVIIKSISPSSNCIVHNNLVYWINPDNQSVTLQSTGGILGRSTHYLKSEADNKTLEVIVPEIVENNGVEYKVIAIARGVFDSMHELRFVFIPKYVKEIKWSFWECEKLERITVAPDNAFYCDIDGVLFSKDKKTLIAFPQGRSSEYTVPEGVEQINNMAFKNNKTIKKLIIPDSLTNIGINAFYRCENLEEIRGNHCHDIHMKEFTGQFGAVNPRVFFDYGETKKERTLSSFIELEYDKFNYENYP